MTSDEISEKHEFSVSMFRGRERVVSALRWQMSSDQVYSISLDGPDGPVAGGGSDLFQALQEIRLEVEPQGWLLAVQGPAKTPMRVEWCETWLAHDVSMLFRLVGRRSERTLWISSPRRR
jgi:hypothetical protein